MIATLPGCLTYDQATPHRNDPRSGGAAATCTGTELERRARRALAAAKRDDPASTKVGEIALDLATACRKSGEMTMAREFLDEATRILDAALTPGDPRRLTLERERRLLAPSP